MKKRRMFLVFLLCLVLGMQVVFAEKAALRKDLLPFTDNDTLEDIRFKIAYNDFHFTVNHNWVFDMSPEEKADFFSRHPGLDIKPVSDDIGPVKNYLNKDLPTAFDWRSVAGHTYIGPVRNQGSCGACYAFGACAAAEGTYNWATGNYDANCIDFSESFIMWCLSTLPAYSSHFGGCDGADYDYQELEAMCTDGIIRESDFPYVQSDPGCNHWSDPRLYFQSWYRVDCNNIDAIKAAIYTYGVVDAAVYVDSAFQAYSGGIYENTSTSCPASPCYNTTTNHAISLVGWDDNPPEGGGGVWILRNSWGGGSSWGENGYMRIRYNSARVSCAVCYMVYSSVPPTSTPNPPTNTPTSTIPQPTSTSLPPTTTSTPVDPTSSPQPTNSPNPPTGTPPQPTASSTPATGPATPTSTDTPTLPPQPTNSPIPPTNTPEPPCLHTGDVNDNGAITAGDAQLAFQIALGQYSPTQMEECAADCNNSGNVTAGDAQQIFQAALGSASCIDPLKGPFRRNAVSLKEIQEKIQVNSGNTIRLESHTSGDLLVVSVFVSVVTKPVDAVTFDVKFDPEQLQYERYEIGSLNPGWFMFDCRETQPGNLRIAGFSNNATIPIHQEGSLVSLYFDMKNSTGEFSDPVITRLMDDLTFFASVK